MHLHDTRHSYGSTLQSMRMTMHKPQYSYTGKYIGNKVTSYATVLYFKLHCKLQVHIGIMTAKIQLATEEERQ